MANLKTKHTPVASHEDMTISYVGYPIMIGIDTEYGKESWVKSFSTLEEAEDFLTMFNFDEDE